MTENDSSVGSYTEDTAIDPTVISFFDAQFDRKTRNLFIARKKDKKKMRKEGRRRNREERLLRAHRAARN